MKFYIEMQVEMDWDMPVGVACQVRCEEDIKITLNKKIKFHHFYACPLKNWIPEIPESTE